jgi:hypothetical protein
MPRILMVGAGSRARRPWLALAVVVGIALAAAPTLAHHSRAMFDVGKNMTYVGVVEEYQWQNPHSHIVRSDYRGGSSEHGWLQPRGKTSSSTEG